MSTVTLLLHKVHQWEGDVERRSSIRRWLPALALLIGIGWMIGMGLRWGIRDGGDTADYLQRIEFLKTHGLSGLYHEQVLPAHMTTVWMAWLGPRGFVLLTVLLTAFLPFLTLMILRQCGVGIVWRLGALLYIGANPELYQWAWFTLTDGFFLIQVVLLLVLITRPTYPRLWWLVIPLMLYNILYTRPTGFLLIPGLFAFAFLARQRPRRRALLAVILFLAVWHGGWLYATRDAKARHVAIVRQTFINGHLLQDPRMSEPLPVPFTPEQAEGRSIGALCASHPSYCATYYSRKWLTYFWPVFPKYSLRHKVFNALYFGGLIVLSLIGVVLLARRGWRERWERVGVPRRRMQTALCCLLVVLTAGAFHTATHIDSDARFLMVWTPVWICGVFLLAASAMTEPAVRRREASPVPPQVSARVA